MHPFLILAIAVAIVLTAILVFRLHAFLALLAAGLTVALLTPAAVIEQSELSSAKVTTTVVDDHFELKVSGELARPGTQFLVVRPDSDGQIEPAGALRISKVDAAKKTATAVIADDSPLTTSETDQALEDGAFVVHASDLAAARDVAKKSAPARVASGFGKTCQGIAILIAMAAIIGKCLLESGAADRIVRFTLAIIGQSRAPIAFVASGFILGIPVFFDTVFYLMIPLGKAMQLRTGKHYVLYILTIVAGATMAHSLVPPTPGPLYVAEELGVGLLEMILMGTLVGLFASVFGYLYALWLDRNMEVPLRESEDSSLKELEEVAKRDTRELPNIAVSLLPIVLPVLLIAIGTAHNTYMKSFAGTDSEPAEIAVAIKPVVSVIGDKNIALMAAAAVALVTLAVVKRNNFKQLAASVQSALASGGVIILITAAGGAFGAMVRQCGVSDQIAALTGDMHPLLILPVAFLVTTLVRTAQGSATVAMITAVSILSHLAPDQVSPLFLALAIGCGSKPVAWMADSGFWVICKMSGMTEAEGLKTVTPMSIIMGLAGLVATMILAAIWGLFA